MIMSLLAGWASPIVASASVMVACGAARFSGVGGAFLARRRREGLSASAGVLLLAGCVARRPFRGARGLTLRAVVRTDDVTNRDRVSAADLQGLRKPYESTDHARCGSAAVGWLTTAKSLCSEPGFASGSQKQDEYPRDPWSDSSLRSTCLGDEKQRPAGDTLTQRKRQKARSKTIIRTTKRCTASDSHVLEPVHNAG